jgi:murein peptide amidase A
MRRLRALLAAALAVALATPAPAAVERAQAPPAPRVERLGRSVEGRPINVVRIGDPAAPRKVLVVGCIHGNEPEGRKVVDLLRGAVPPPGAELLLVKNLNPDGFARNTRQNAHGVDLKRNSSQGRRFLGGPGSPYYAGPKAFSEPETRAIRALILRVRPAVTVWYHQPFGRVDRPESGGDAISRTYSRISGLRFAPLSPRPGSMSRWENVRVRAGSSIVVELPPGRVPAAVARRHADAVLALAAAAPAAPSAP